MVAPDLTPKMDAPPTYLTVIPTRRPRDKMHHNLGHAKNALTHMARDGQIRIWGALYEWKDGAWTLLYEVWPGMLKANLPWK